MKQFIIMRCEEKHLYDFSIRVENDASLRLESSFRQDTAPVKHPHSMEEPAAFYFVATDKEAKMLVKFLVKHFPETSWIIAETRTYVRQLIVEVETQYLSVTEKGVLPCAGW
jgi:hypothetical protein